MIDIILYLAVGMVFLTQYVLGRFGLRLMWGSVIPAVWLLVIFLLWKNGQISNFRDYLIAAIGYVLLYIIFGRGVEDRRNKIKKEINKIENKK